MADGHLAAARRLGDAAIDDDVLEPQSDHAVVPLMGDVLELIDVPQRDRFVTAAAQGGAEQVRSAMRQWAQPS